MMLAIRCIVIITICIVIFFKEEAVNHNDAGNTVYSNYNILHSKKINN